MSSSNNSQSLAAPVYEGNVSLGFPHINTIHKKPYPAISPLKPELSQAGKTILITGAAGGVGFAIARAYIQASASQVIITSRREGFLNEGVSRLQAEAKAFGSSTKVSGYASDSSNPDASKKLWTGFKEAGIFVDVLVLNAAVAGPIGPLLDADVDELWKTYEINVRSLIDYAQRFNAQQGTKKKYLVNVSTSIVHNLNNENPALKAYGVTKSAGTLVIQQIASDADPDQLQIISFNPGAILTDGARGSGLTDDSWFWDDENLPGQFAVWAATSDAKPFHGRFLASWWDVDELRKQEFQEKLESDQHLLRIGIVGLL